MGSYVLSVSNRATQEQRGIMGKGQNDEGGFSEEQVQMYKDCFKLMDINKDGTLDKNDLRGAFDNIGVLMSESELDDLMGEETVTTLTSSSSRLSLPTTRTARLTSRCSSTPSGPGGQDDQGRDRRHLQRVRGG